MQIGEAVKEGCIEGLFRPCFAYLQVMRRQGREGAPHPGGGARQRAQGVRRRRWMRMRTRRRMLIMRRGG